MKIVQPVSWIVLSFLSAVASSVPVDHGLTSLSIETGKTGVETPFEDEEKPLQDDTGAGGNKYDYKDKSERSDEATAFKVTSEKKAKSIQVVSICAFFISNMHFIIICSNLSGSLFLAFTND
jgi:hypothetical protein